MCDFNNSKQITINKQYKLKNNKEQPLLFSLVHPILFCLQLLRPWRGDLLFL